MRFSTAPNSVQPGRRGFPRAGVASKLPNYFFNLHTVRAIYGRLPFTPEAYTVYRNPANPDLSGLVHSVRLILKSTIVGFDNL